MESEMGISGKSCMKILRVALVTALLFAIGTVTPSIAAAKRVTTTSGCIPSSRTWVNSALPQVETGTFRLEFDATPAATGIDGVIGLSSGPASDYTNLAAIVRFNSMGTIDASKWRWRIRRQQRSRTRPALAIISFWM